MLQLSVLPKVVRVTEGWRGTTLDTTIETNQLLVLKGLKRKLNHKFVKAVSVPSKEKKELPENCAGRQSNDYIVLSISLPYQYLCMLKRSLQ